jgi:SMC interacting uncharacterized protein involved in chromosome segregation
LKQKYNQEFYNTQNEEILLQESIDTISWTLSQKEEEVKNMISRIQGLSVRYREEKGHIGLALTATTEEIENYERQISRLKIISNNALVTSQQKAQKAAVEYDSLTRKYTEQKEKTLNQVVTGLVQVFNFQQHVSSTVEMLTNQLSDQNNLVEARVIH